MKIPKFSARGDDCVGESVTESLAIVSCPDRKRTDEIWDEVGEAVNDP